MEYKTVLSLNSKGEWEYYFDTTAPTLVSFYEGIKIILTNYPTALKFQGEEEILIIENL